MADNSEISADEKIYMGYMHRFAQDAAPAGDFLYGYEADRGSKVLDSYHRQLTLISNIFQNYLQLLNKDTADMIQICKSMVDIDRMSADRLRRGQGEKDDEGDSHVEEYHWRSPVTYSMGTGYETGDLGTMWKGTEYHVRYAALEETQALIAGYREQWDARLETVRTDIGSFDASACISGDSGDAVRAYLQKCHLTLIDDFRDMVKWYAGKYGTYKADYRIVDDASDTELATDELYDTFVYHGKMQDAFGETAGKVGKTLAGISDIIDLDPPDPKEINDESEEIISWVKLLWKNFMQYEDDHYRMDFGETDSLIEGLKTKIREGLQRERGITLLAATDPVYTGSLSKSISAGTAATVGQIDINIYRAGQPEGMSDRDYLKLLQELQAAGAPLTAVNIRNMVKLRGTCIAPVTGTLKRDDVYEWVKPTYRLSKEEKQHARQVIAEYKKENPGYVKYTDAIKTKTGGGYLKTIPEGTLAEYRRMDLLQAKMDNLTIVAAGAAGTIEIPAAQLGHLGERIGVGAGEKMASLLPWTDREKLSRGSIQLNAGADQYLNGILQYHYGMHNQNPAAYNAGAIAANVGEIYVCNRVTDQISGVAENGATGACRGENRTGTVWDNIKATQDVYPSTNIPRSFEVHTNGQKIWVHGNATEHIYEDVYKGITSGNGTAFTNPNLYTQELMTDFYGALEQATKSEITYGEKINSGNWEFIFAKSRQEGNLPVIKHSKFNGKR